MHTEPASRLRVLFDVQHPAQVHLFRHAIEELQAAGHETMVLSRDKEMTLDLLDAYGIEHRSLSRRRGGLPAAVFELGVRELRTIQAAREFAPDVIVGRVSPSATHAASLLGARSVVVTDTDIDGTVLGRAFHAITLPFADVVCRPPDLELPTADANQRDLGKQELAYLHPDRFTPEPAALERHGVDPDEPYAVVRLAGWDAYHDVGHEGISETVLRKLVAMLSGRGRVFLSTERDGPVDLDTEPFPVPIHLVHDLLYHADLYVGDSGTMSTEAAMLGTPSVRLNSVDGEDDEGIFRSLEADYGLLFSFSDGEAALRKARDLWDGESTAATWERRRASLLADAPDVTDELLAIIRETATRRTASSAAPAATN